MKLQGKRVAVLGGNGFIGNRLSRQLLAMEASVTCFDMNPCREPIPGVVYVTGDFFETDELLSAIRGTDCIIHAVSTINPGSSQTQYLRGYTKDFAQTAVLCDYAWQHGQRLLFLSSGGTVYGKKEMPIGESETMNPINHYGGVKLCIETMMQVFIQQGADFRIARVSNPYGPGQDFQKGVGFVDAAVKHALNGTPIEIWGDGSIVRDYIHVDDACRMLCDVLTHEGQPRIFNIGSGVGLSQQAVVDLIRDIIGHAEVKYLPHRAIDAPSVVLDVTRYQTQFAFRPRKFASGVKAYIAWLQEHEGLADRIKEEKAMEVERKREAKPDGEV